MVFEPMTVGAGLSQGSLIISNPQAGHFVVPLEGNSLPPQPLGPIVVKHKEISHMTFKNVFPVTTAFTMHVSQQLSAAVSELPRHRHSR